MSFDEFEMPQSLDTSNFLSADGWYHVLVTKVDTQPKKDDGSPINGKKFSFRVLAGTDPSQKGSSHNELIGNPSMDHRDGGEFARKVNARAAIAMNCLSPGAQGKVQVDWNRAMGQTLVVKIVKDKNDEKYFRVDGAHYYHVNDEAVKDVPKDFSAVQSAPQAPAQQQMQQPPQQVLPQQPMQPPQTQQYAPQQQTMLPQGYQQAPQQPVPQQPPQQGYQQPLNGQQPVGINDL